MTQHLSYQWTYPVTPLKAFQMRNRLDYLSEKGRSLGQENFRVLELRERAGRFRCVQEYDLEVILPGWMTRLRFTPRNTITQYEIWHAPEPDGSRSYDVAVEIGRVPVTITGFGLTTPLGPVHTRSALQLQITSRLPVLRDRLEEFVAGQVDHNAEGEGAFRYQWLERIGMGAPPTTSW